VGSLKKKIVAVFQSQQSPRLQLKLFKHFTHQPKIISINDK